MDQGNLTVKHLMRLNEEVNRDFSVYRGSTEAKIFELEQLCQI
jgi:hypothetical protein